jgi:hypothetical protein
MRSISRCSLLWTRDLLLPPGSSVEERPRHLDVARHSDLARKSPRPLDADSKADSENNLFSKPAWRAHHDRGVSPGAASDIADDPLISKVPSSASMPFM